MDINTVSSRLVDLDRLDPVYYKQEYVDNDKNLMGKSFKRIMDISSLITKGETPLSKGFSYQKSGIPLIRGKDVKNGYIDFSDVVYIEEEVHQGMKRSKLSGGKFFLLTMAGTLGDVAIFDNEKMPESNINQDIAKIKINDEVDLHFLTIYFQTKYVIKQILRLQNGMTRGHLNFEQIKKIIIPKVEPKIQKYIGDKIRKAESLREEANYLRKESSKIFYQHISKIILEEKKFWVVDPGMVNDRLDINYYNQNYLLLNQLFSSLNPKNIKSISELSIKIYGGYPFSTNDFHDYKGMPLIRIRDIKKSIINVETDAFIAQSLVGSNYVSSTNKVIVGMDGNDFLAGVFTDDMPKCAINQRIAIIETSDAYLANYLAFFINTQIGQMQLNRESVKTTVGHINLRNIEELRVFIPPKDAYNVISKNILKANENVYKIKLLVAEAKKEIEDLIEGNFDEANIK